MEIEIERAGKKYKFDRNAVEDRYGGVPLSQLRDDELVISPSLIYREVKQLKTSP